jgi:hypothetical protein
MTNVNPSLRFRVNRRYAGAPAGTEGGTERGVDPNSNASQNHFQNQRLPTTNATTQQQQQQQQHEQHHQQQHQQQQQLNPLRVNIRNTIQGAARAGSATNSQESVHWNQQQQQRQRQQQTQVLRRLQIIIPPPRPLPQINVSINKDKLKLKEQPILQQQTQPFNDALSSNNGNCDDQSKNKSTIVSSFPSSFECSICYEIMTKPFKCGHVSCGGRFCPDCIHKEFEVQNNNNHNNNESSNNTKQCPCCRENFQFTASMTSSSLPQEFLHIDTTLKSEIQNSLMTKYCINKNFGCPVLCKPINTRLHEQTCHYQPFKCKYAELGCTFQHTKLCLQLHYQNGSIIDSSPYQQQHMNRSSSSSSSVASTKNNIPGCIYVKLLPIVLEQRSQTIKFQHLHSIITSQFIQERSTLINTTSQIMTLEFKSLYNGMDIVSCIYIATCHTISFCWKSLVWKSFWNCSTTRGIMNNYIALIPTFCWIFRIGLSTLKRCWDLIGLLDNKGGRTVSGSHSFDDGGSILYLLSLDFASDIILAFCTMALGLSMFLCFVSVHILIIIIINCIMMTNNYTFVYEFIIKKRLILHIIIINSMLTANHQENGVKSQFESSFEEEESNYQMRPTRIQFYNIYNLYNQYLFIICVWIYTMTTKRQPITSRASSNFYVSLLRPFSHPSLIRSYF